jgi:hypothetical protein
MMPSLWSRAVQIKSIETTVKPGPSQDVAGISILTGSEMSVVGLFLIVQDKVISIVEVCAKVGRAKCSPLLKDGIQYFFMFF